MTELPEHYADKDREYWSWDAVIEVKDERNKHYENSVAEFFAELIANLESGNTESALEFMKECHDAATKEESIDDVAWDWSQKGSYEY